MFVEGRNAKYLDEDLHTVLEYFYSANAIWMIMKHVGYPLKGVAPPSRKPRKVLLMEEIYELMNSDQYMARLPEVLKPRLKEILDVLVWEGDTKLDELEERLGFELTVKKIVPPMYHFRKEETSHTLQPEFCWVAYENRGNSEYDYYRERWLTVCLPPAVRSVLKKFMPRPKGYDIEPLEELDPQWLTYRCDEGLATDLRVVSEYIGRGLLQFTQQEVVRKGCVRSIGQLTKGGEFFENETLSKKLPLLRHELFVNVIACCGPKMRNAMLLAASEPEAVFRPFVDTLFQHPDWFHEFVLTHVHCKDRDRYSVEAAGQLRRVFAMLSEKHWTSIANLQSVVFYRDIDVDVLSHSYCQVTIDRESPGYDYSNRVSINDSNAVDLMLLPLLQGSVFLLAALGLAEIAYTLPPLHGTWRRTSERFLTPFDGLEAVRLTPVGAYAFGLSDVVELVDEANTRAEILFNPQRLIASCPDVDSITEESLLKYMEKISTGCYRLTRQSLLRGCSVKADVEQRVQSFRQHVTDDLPENWDAFLDSVVQTAVGMKRQNKFQVFELLDSSELRRLFMSDPVLREKTFRVEGLRVAVRKDDLPTVYKRLAALGYLVQ